MNEEIKDIVDYIKKWMSLSDIPMIVKLEDYITNLQQENSDLNKIIENINAIGYQSADEIWLKARHDIEDLDDFANDIDHYIAPYITYNYKSHLKAIIKYLVRLFKQHCDYK